MSTEPEPTWMLATCHTAGCPEDGKTYRVPCYPNSEPPTYRVVCMGCGEQVTDLVAA
jgi:hypothetical protein